MSNTYNSDLLVSSPTEPEPPEAAAKSSVGRSAKNRSTIPGGEMKREIDSKQIRGQHT
jgi:hypothetical protein